MGASSKDFLEKRPIKKAFVIDWMGPFTFVELAEKSKKNENIDACFYMVSGYCKCQRTKRLQYCGISERGPIVRMLDGGHKCHEVTRGEEIWIGEFEDKELQQERKNLELVEALLIFTQQFELNDKKKDWIPEKPVAIINFWKNTKGKDIRGKQKGKFLVPNSVGDVIVSNGQMIFSAKHLNLGPFPNLYGHVNKFADIAQREFDNMQKNMK